MNFAWPVPPSGMVAGLLAPDIASAIYYVRSVRNVWIDFQITGEAIRLQIKRRRRYAGPHDPLEPYSANNSTLKNYKFN